MRLLVALTAPVGSGEPVHLVGRVAEPAPWSEASIAGAAGRDRTCLRFRTSGLQPGARPFRRRQHVIRSRPSRASPGQPDPPRFSLPTTHRPIGPRGPTDGDSDRALSASPASGDSRPSYRICDGHRREPRPIHTENIQHLAAASPWTPSSVTLLQIGSSYRS